MATVDTDQNIFIGTEAIAGLQGTTRNIAIGYEAVNAITQSEDNILIGRAVANSANGSHDNTIIGAYAGYSLNDGTDNVCIGAASGYSLFNSNYNVYVGKEAGRNARGDENLFIGTYAGRESRTANHNTFIGMESGFYNDNGNAQVFIGKRAGYMSNRGAENVLIGAYSGARNNAGSFNVFLGFAAGHDNTKDENVFIGAHAGGNAIASNSFFLGHGAGTATIGDTNVVIGTQSAKGLVGNLNVVVGTYANVSRSENTVVFGSHGQCSNTTDVIVFGTRSNCNNLSNVVYIGPGGQGIEGKSNVTIVGALPNSDASLVSNDTVYLSVPSKIILAANSSQAVISGNLKVDGEIEFTSLSGLTNLSQFTNDLFIPWDTITNTPPVVTSLSSIFPDKILTSRFSNGNVIVETPEALWWDHSNYYLGIGVDPPQYRLDIEGVVRSTQGFLLNSDARLKKDVITIESALDKVRQISGYTYSYTGSSERQGGVISQEVGKVLPEAIREDPRTGMQAVDYNAIIALLIEAVKELAHQRDLGSGSPS